MSERGAAELARWEPWPAMYVVTSAVIQSTTDSCSIEGSIARASDAPQNIWAYRA
jgi:hypothetical protein